MKNKKIWIGMIVLVIFAGTGYYLLNKSTDATVVEIVKEYTVKEDDIVIDFISDGIVTMDEYELAFKTGGVVDAVSKNIGDEIKVNDLIAKLDTTELELKREQLEISIESLKAKINDDLKDYNYDQTAQNFVIDAIKKDIVTETSLLDIMEKNTNLYSRVEIETQKDKVDTLNDELKLETLKLSNVIINPTTQDNLSLKDLEIELELMDYDILSSSLIAQIEGVIVELNGGTGTTVGTTNPFVIVQDQENPYIVAMVSELDIYNVYIGQKVYAEFESDFGVPFSGEVSHISQIPSIDNNNIVTYRVDIKLEQFPESNKAGLSTLLNFILKEKNDILVIPNTAVKIEDNKQFVEVKTETGSEKRSIITGLTDGLNVEVIEGLSSGDIVLIKSTN
jgi:multidrug efflux pump subunit AcrA (membrane-fusion protein)